jgi:repressor LexA
MTLSEQQHAVLAFLERYVTTKGKSPTMAEIQQHFKFSSPSTVHHHLSKLEKAGNIRRTPNISRGIEIVRRGDEHGETDIPLLGYVAAGKPIITELNDEWLTIPRAMAGKKRTFGLIVRGDSMSGDGILDGDYLVVEASETANHRDIIVALIDDGAVVKYFFREKGQVVLKSSNPAYKPIKVKPSQRFLIRGKLLGVLRLYDRPRK